MDTPIDAEAVERLCHAAPFADNEAGIPQMVATLRALRAALTAAEAALASARVEGARAALEAAEPVAVALLKDMALRHWASGRNLTSDEINEEVKSGREAIRALDPAQIVAKGGEDAG
jgi:hypothetical protein